MPRVNETFSERSNHHMYLLTVDVVWVIGQKRAFFSILIVTGFRIFRKSGENILSLLKNVLYQSSK